MSEQVCVLPGHSGGAPSAPEACDGLLLQHPDCAVSRRRRDALPGVPSHPGEAARNRGKAAKANGANGVSSTIAAGAVDYRCFLATKREATIDAGFAVADADLNQALFDWQRQIVGWALRRGRAAIFADCGLGKTPMQLVWAEHVSRHSGLPVLILAPLAVARQTALEGAKFGVPVKVCRAQADVQPGVNVANYEMLAHFDSAAFGGLVLDESSILKGDGPTRRGVTDFARSIPYRLACTATPAPNDTDELINHAEFLDIIRGDEILALYFIQDGNTTHKWRLKGHAREAFWKWLASWSIAIRKPSDLGYPDAAFALPPIHYHQHTVEAPIPTDALFQAEAMGIKDQRRVRKETLEDRVVKVADMVNESEAPWAVWCDLNAESKLLAALIPGSVEVTGADPSDTKEARLADFAEGRARVIVTKPDIAGFGLNWQHCSNQAFVGLGNSYEKYYQAVRRCWRFGQSLPVNVHVVTSEADGPIVRNIERKERQASEMMAELIEQMRPENLTADGAVREEMVYAEDYVEGRNWKMLLGDCVDQAKTVADESVGVTVFSPPFPSMYVYTNSPHDMGNCASFEEMLAHYAFLIPELLRITMPGRSCYVHLTQALSFKGKDGHAGMKDFRGEVIKTMETGGFHYYGEWTIDKNPQLKAIRTKDRGLLFKTLATDASHMHAALADYVIQFRKPGMNPEPIAAGISEKYENRQGWITQEQWIRWARPVWYAADFDPDGDGINETDVLSVISARETEDERHLCPLQLGVIERCIKLGSNPGDLVFSPFGGIGSEGYQALLFKRRFVGIELKRAYWEYAVRNLKRADAQMQQGSLLDLMGAP